MVSPYVLMALSTTFAVVCRCGLGLEFGHGPALGRFLKALARVRHPKRHRLHAVPVLVEVALSAPPSLSGVVRTRVILSWRST